MTKNSSNRQKVFNFILRFFGEHKGLTPTVREIAAGVELSSTAVDNQLKKLRKNNKIDYDGGARSITISNLHTVLLYVCPECGHYQISGGQCPTHKDKTLILKKYRETDPYDRFRERKA